jgi:hypothetical protein
VELLEYLPYGPDLAPSDFCLLDLLNNHIDGKCFTDEKVEIEVWNFCVVGLDSLAEQ